MASSVQEAQRRRGVLGIGSAGAFQSGGPTLYLSTTLPLAALEVLAHWADYYNLDGYGVFTVDPPDDFEFERLPDDVNVRDAAACTAYGAAWLAEARTAALVVPSVLMPAACAERHVILNPRHPEFDQLLGGLRAHGPFVSDPRIKGALSSPDESLR
ncbi:RES family NAD+ phosphorylase [Deinococcus sp.]|uniref:RES family NAD+ phosphorylase n=1 Tax=Deinococcus sp. TaxID=47478 RepID=UPI0028698A79|nr:RES family NAD+ phosphorylase [Deinococcus sp.]